MAQRYCRIYLSWFKSRHKRWKSWCRCWLWLSGPWPSSPPRTSGPSRSSGLFRFFLLLSLLLFRLVVLFIFFGSIDDIDCGGSIWYGFICYSLWIEQRTRREWLLPLIWISKLCHCNLPSPEHHAFDRKLK